ncbi:MAG TPA: hypothetical protein VMU59_11970 [Caulobacteraceae bacterium]|nr:hypothetical protein [Caulobacteraceae bacterium]
MKTAFALVAVCALALPASSLAQTYAHAAGRPVVGAPRAVPGRVIGSAPAYRQAGGAWARPAAGASARYAGERRSDRYGGGAGFGLGVVTGAAIAGAYDGGYGGYGAYGYAGYPAYDGGYAYTPGESYSAPDYGADYGYQANESAYLAGGYPPASAPEYAQPGYALQGYMQQDYGQTQTYQAAPAPAYGGAAGGQGEPSVATRQACGQWTWDAPIGRYVWAC